MILCIIIQCKKYFLLIHVIQATEYTTQNNEMNFILHKWTTHHGMLKNNACNEHKSLCTVVIRD